jgi:hypothetical protein
MKKALLSLVLALALIAMFAAPALAASTLNITTPSMYTDDGNWANWRIGETGITLDMMKNVIRVEIEMENFEDWTEANHDWGRRGIGAVVATPNNAWQDVPSSAITYAGGKYSIDLSSFRSSFAEITGEEDAAFGFYVGDDWWGVSFRDMGATRVTLVYEGAGGGGSSGGGGDKENAAGGGDATMIALALIALALAGGAAFFVSRKIKA